MPSLPPQLKSPILSEGADADAVVFNAVYRHPLDVEAGKYELTRQRLDVLGAVEYLQDDDTWTETPTQRTAVAGLFDGYEITIGPVDDFEPGGVYRWWLKFWDTGDAVEGAQSVPGMFVASEPLSITLDIGPTETESRPVVRWAYADADTAAHQRGYEMFVYMKTTSDDAEFDPDDPSWQSIAVWNTDGIVVSSTAYSHRIAYDLQSGDQAEVFMRVLNEEGVWSGWFNQEFEISNIAPPQPVLGFIPEYDEGYVTVVVDAAFNMLGENSSSFDDGVGKWLRDVNCQIEHSSGELRIISAGITFDEADTIATDFDDADTEWTDFEDAFLHQETDEGISRIKLGDEADYENQLLPAIPEETYTAIASLRPSVEVGSTTAWMSFEFFDASGSSLGVLDGTPTTIIPGEWTTVSTDPQEAPADSAWVQLKVAVEMEPAGAVCRMDNVAMARSDEVTWTPGGLNQSLLFSLSRSLDGGPWEYVWNASRVNPFLVEGAKTVAEIPDRSHPIGHTGVRYRAVVSTLATGIMISSEVAEADCPTFFTPGWWLRCVDGSCPDVRLRSMEFSYSHSPAVAVVASRGEFGQVIRSGDSPSRTISCEAFLFNKDEYDAAKLLLESGTLLYVQRNIGDGFYIKVTGTTRIQQRRAVGGVLKDQPRHLHVVSFQAEVQAPPKDLYE